MIVKKYIDIEVEVTLSESSKQSNHLNEGDKELKNIISAIGNTMEFES